MAIANIERYEKFVDDILRRIEIMTTMQLIIALTRMFPDCDSDNFALEIIKGLQRRGRLLLTHDGYVITEGAYHFYTNDKFNDNLNLNGVLRIPDKMSRVTYLNEHKREFHTIGNVPDFISKKEREMMETFWIVVDMMPGSSEFCATIPPFIWAYEYETKEGETKLYKVAKINKRSLFADVNMLKEIIRSEEEEKKYLTSLRYIALIEDGVSPSDIPYLGFKYICKLNENKRSHYDLCEKRGDDYWKDL